MSGHSRRNGLGKNLPGCLPKALMDLDEVLKSTKLSSGSSPRNPAWSVISSLCRGKGILHFSKGNEPFVEVINGDTVQFTNHLVGVLSLLSKEIPSTKDRSCTTLPPFLDNEASQQAISVSILLFMDFFSFFFLICLHPYFMFPCRLDFPSSSFENRMKIGQGLFLEGVKKWNADLEYRMAKREGDLKLKSKKLRMRD